MVLYILEPGISLSVNRRVEKMNIIQGRISHIAIGKREPTLSIKRNAPWKVSFGEDYIWMSFVL